MTTLPSAETFYPDFPGLPVAERAVFRYACCPNPSDPLAVMGALRDYLAGTPHGRLTKRPDGFVEGAVVRAHVNHGRWLVECPNCHAGQHVSLSDPRFFCAECLNGGTGKFIPVDAPSASKVKQIDRLLAQVGHVPARNWLPHETVKELAEQVHTWNRNLEAAVRRGTEFLDGPR